MAGEQQDPPSAEEIVLYAKDPARQGRDASRYLRDMFLHYGTTQVEKPWGKRTRFRLFDLPFADPQVRRDVAHAPRAGDGRPRPLLRVERAQQRHQLGQQRAEERHRVDRRERSHHAGCSRSHRLPYRSSNTATVP